MNQIELLTMENMSPYHGKRDRLQIRRWVREKAITRIAVQKLALEEMWEHGVLAHGLLTRFGRVGLPRRSRSDLR